MAAAVALLVALVPITMLLTWGLPVTHDGFWHLNWGYHWNEQVLGGQLLPRWFEQAHGGLGSPAFSFYPPLTRMLSFPFAVVGASPFGQLLGAIGCIFLVNSFGTLAFASSLFRRRLFVIIAIFVSGLNPYLILNVFYRGAMAEACAMAVIPWVLVGTKIAFESKSVFRFAPLAISWTVFSLAHLPTGLEMGFLLGAYMLVCTRTTVVDLFLRLWVPVGLGTGMAALYLLPALLDQEFIQLWPKSPHVGFEHHFRYLIDGAYDLAPQLTQHGFDRGLLIYVVYCGFWLLAFLAVRAVAPQRGIPFVRMKMLVFFGLLSLVMTLDLSRPIYWLFPSLIQIQFAWRFLSVSTQVLPFIVPFVVAAAAPTTAEFFCHNGLERWRPLLMFGIPVGMLVGLLWLAPHQPSFATSQMKLLDALLGNVSAVPPRFDELTTIPSAVHGNMFGYLRDPQGRIYVTDPTEYLPRQADRRQWLRHSYDWVYIPKQDYPLAEVSAGTGTVVIKDWSPSYRVLAVDAQTPVFVDVRTLYYPGWELEIGTIERPECLGATADGRLRVELPAGRHRVALRYRGTTTERCSPWISLVALFLLVAYSAAYHRARPLFPRGLPR